MDKTSDIIFFVIATTVILFLLGVMIINLLLIVRNRKLKHGNHILQLNTEYQKELSKVQVEVIESTLNDVSHQLHDDVGQMIAFSIVQINNIELQDKNLQIELNAVRESIQNSMNSLRTISKTLNTEYIKSFGIYESLDRLLENAQRMSGIIIHSNYNKLIIFKSHSRELFCFRILQELITNTIKHSQASEIHLSFEEENEFICITYFDNGKGIETKDINKLKSKSSLGFANILKRTELMNGKIVIDDKKNGFHLLLTLENV